MLLVAAVATSSISIIIIIIIMVRSLTPYCNYYCCCEFYLEYLCMYTASHLVTTSKLSLSPIDNNMYVCLYVIR